MRTVWESREQLWAVELLALQHSNLIRSYRKSSCLLAAQKYVSNWLCWHFTVCKLMFLRKFHRIYVCL